MESFALIALDAYATASPFYGFGLPERKSEK